MRRAGRDRAHLRTVALGSCDEARALIEAAVAFGVVSSAERLKADALADRVCVIVFRGPTCVCRAEATGQGRADLGEASQGSPLISHQVIVNLIAATTTDAGLTVRSRLDGRTYASGRRVSDQQLALVNLEPDAFHGEWNYTIHPSSGCGRN